MVIIKCKKCGSIEERGGTTMIALEVFDKNTEVEGLSCGECVSKIELKFHQRIKWSVLLIF